MKHTMTEIENFIKNNSLYENGYRFIGNLFDGKVEQMDFYYNEESGLIISFDVDKKQFFTHPQHNSRIIQEKG